jgi:hypothetical protein
MQSVDSNFTSAKFKQLKGKMLISLMVQIVKFFFCDWWLFAHVNHEMTNKP